MSHLDASTPFIAQLRETAGPVVWIDTYVVPEGAMDQVVSAWHGDASFMKAQAGFVSAVLYRGIGSSKLLVAVSSWESAEAVKIVFASYGFRDKAKRYPDGVVVYPHIFQEGTSDDVDVA